MAGLFLVRDGARDGDPAFAQDALAAARRRFADGGFTATRPLAIPGWTGLHAPYINGGPDTLLVRGEDLVAVAGTLTVDGRMGAPALAALLDGHAPPALDWSRIGGQFVCLWRRAGRTFLFTDWFAAFQLFHDAERRLFSTSLLAATESLPAVSFSPQGLYEFAFNVVPIGNDTVLAELRTLGPDTVVELTPDGTILHPVAKPLPRAATAEPVADRIERHRARLRDIVRAHVGQFGNAIHCPLSGGLDSRLLLAALRERGCRPMVYVYGPPGDADVAIARAIGTAEDFPVEWIEKAREPLPPDAFPEQVQRNFREFDGLPNFGTLFDNGGNAAARDRRHAGGALAASGGCGEVYRDFFFLPDRPLTAAALARTFFARFTRRDVTPEFDETTFLGTIRDKLADALDAPRDRPIPRTVIEQAYPRLRCRSLFGREISLEARWGAYMMPFLDHQVVTEAMTLPMPLRQAGRFEAQLLHAIDPALARHPSAYGHDFASPPGRRHRFDEWSARIRPPWLRQRSYAIRRLRPTGDEHGGLLTPDYMARVVDLDLPIMRRWFDVPRINDAGLWRRVACLEYFAGQLGTRLRG